MSDSRGSLREIDPDAEADRLARVQAAGAGIREGTTLPVTVEGKVRWLRVTTIDTLGNGAIRLTCVPEAAHD